VNIDLTTIRFGAGEHAATDSPTGSRDLCIMEAVAYMAGEPWSDSPACASPVIAAFLRSWQDALSEADRDRLLPAAVWVPRLVGSRGDDATEERRAYMALDWLIRVHVPTWFDLTPSLREHAAALRGLTPIVGFDTARVAGNVVRAAGAAAWDAAGAAAGAAAWDAAGAAAGAAAWDAAGAAAWDAAWAAAWAAARNAARAAAGDAAWAAAWAAAGGAARGALRPTVELLQQSALDLLDRMLVCGEHRREEEEK
jgi:hypothetical protein